jgi:hypothetical protein
VYQTIASALSDPRLKEQDNCRILLLDETYEEQETIDASQLPQGISIESARTDPPTRWWPPERADPTKPLLQISGGARVTVRNLSFNGLGRVDTLVSWIAPGAGCQLHNIQVTKFTRTGVNLTNPAGEAREPVQLSRVRISPESGVPVEACVLVQATGNRPAHHLRLTECRLEGSATDGLRSVGGIESFEMFWCRLFSFQSGVVFVGPGKLQATLKSNTMARVPVPVRVDALPAADKNSRLVLQSNLFYGAASVVRFADPSTATAELFVGSADNWCEDGGCATPTPGIVVSRTPGLLLGLDPNKDAEFLRYSPKSPLASAGQGNQPIGVPPK